MRRNVASQIVGAQLIAKADGEPVTAGTTSVFVTVDGGTQGAGGGGNATHEGNGWWTYAPTQGETDGAHVAFTFVNSSAVVATAQVYPLATFDPTAAGVALTAAGVDAVWDEVLGGGITGRTLVYATWDTAASILDDTAVIGAAGAGLIAVGLSSGSRAAVADTVWAEPIADHSGVAGSTAASLAAAQSAGDPWSTAVPGAYGAGTAGYIVGTNLDAQVSTAAGLSGANAVTIHTQDVAGDPLVGAVIGVYDATNTTLLDQKTSDSSGDAVFAMDDGTYKLRITRIGYTFTQPETLTVDETPESATFTGTAVTASVDAGAYESRPLRRQKIRYDHANTDTPLTYQRVLAGIKAVPSAATITIYAPGNATALVSAAAMTISGTIATYSPDTTTTVSWPVETGYRARIIATIGGVDYTDDLMFDVVKYILQLNIGVDQLVAIDDRIAAMEHAGDEDFSEVIEAARDEIQARVEAKVIKDKKLIENMILDASRLSIPCRYLVLANIFESKQNHDQSDRYRQRYEDTMRATLASIQYDSNQDLEESSKIGGTIPIRLRR